MTRLSWPARFWHQVDQSSGPQSCWLWTGAMRGEYGRYWDVRLGRRAYAHRIAYELSVGLVPDGLTLDHLCRNPRCVNPAHLEPVTGRVNVLRGSGFAAVNARKTHCIHGHEYTPDNTYHLARGRRQCRACSLVRQKAWNDRHPNRQRGRFQPWIRREGAA